MGVTVAPGVVGATAQAVLVPAVPVVILVLVDVILDAPAVLRALVTVPDHAVLVVVDVLDV